MYVCYNATLNYNKHFKTLILCNIIVYSYPFHCIMSYFLIMMVKKIILETYGNSLIILAKQFKHTCMFMKVRPLFLFLMKELYKKALKDI